MAGNQTYLMHYGILGMRWGIRRTPKQLGHDKSSNSDKKEVVKKKTISDLSDEELRARINRLQMERQYKELTKGQISRGRKFVDFFIKNLGTDILLPAAKDAGKTYMTKTMKTALGVNDNKVDSTEKLRREVQRMTLEKQYRMLKEDEAKYKKNG